jgi:hypothetical protein
MRDQHVRHEDCDKSERPGFEGITEAQKNVRRQEKPLEVLMRGIIERQNQICG